MRLTTRLLILLFLSVLLPLFVLSLLLKQEITDSILKEKEDKLFGLAKQLDESLTGTYDDLLREAGAIDDSREHKIAVLNKKLWAVTDFVASGNSGVGVGYYCKSLDAIVTYGPSKQFQYTVGQSISSSHKGREVMATGKPLVQQGLLVRGNILNCMWPINRDGKTIGYIWSNETLDQISEQLAPILRRLYGMIFLIFFLIYASVAVSTQSLLDKISRIKKGIEVLFEKPTYHIPPISGELSIIVQTINELVDNMNLIKCYNKNILEGVSNGVLALSLEGKVSRVNKAFYGIFPNFSDDTLLGRDYRDVFEQNIQALLKAGIDEPRHHPSVEVSVKNKILEVYGNKMIDEAGERLGAVFVFRDVTMLRRYEQEVKEKERAVALGEMALGVVHEVKNPLTSVKGFAQMLLRSDIPESKRTEYLRLIDSELNRVNRILNEMLVFGGKSRLELRDRDVLSILSDRLDGVNRGDEKRPEVRILSGSSFMASVDELKLAQVFDNVLKNAAEAVEAKPEGKIVVLARSDDKNVTLEFVDTGIGIRERDLDKIGRPLFSTKQDGTGLGLAISRKIVEAHGGVLEIQSKFGAYAKVRVCIPKTAAENGNQREI